MNIMKADKGNKDHETPKYSCPKYGAYEVVGYQVLGLLAPRGGVMDVHRWSSYSSAAGRESKL